MVFALVLFFGIIFDHDLYQALLAVASGMLVYFLALNLIRSRAGRFVFFVLGTVAITQLSVTVKRAVMDVGFKTVLKDNPTGVLFADILYGFRHVVITVGNAFGAIHQALGLDKYSSAEQLHIRFFALIFVLAIWSVYLLKQKPAPKPTPVTAE